VRKVSDGQPITGADVNVTLASSQAPVVYNGKTDATGSANVSLDIPADIEGKVTLVVQTRSSLGQDHIERPVEIKRSYKLYLSTDKPIYQPRPDDSPARAGAECVRPSRRCSQAGRVHRQQSERPTKSFVKKSTRQPLASPAPISNWLCSSSPASTNLQAMMGDTESSRSVEVKPYVLPKFKVNVETDRPYYQPGARVKGDVQADYFFGKPTSQAHVELRGYTYDPDRRQSVEMFGQTDAQGRFHFEFNLPAFFAGGQAGKDRASFDLQVAVIDQAKHREQVGQVLTIARDPLVIDAVAESGTLRPGVENIVYILVSYPDGRPAKATSNGQPRYRRGVRARYPRPTDGRIWAGRVSLRSHVVIRHDARHRRARQHGRIGTQQRQPQN